MKKCCLFYFFIFSLPSLFFLFSSPSLFGCTTLLVTKGATEDGSSFVAHTDDDELGDQRIVYIAAKDHPANAKRPVYPGSTNYPRYVSNRSPYYLLAGEKQTKPTGYIDEVLHTYAYFDGNYGIMNEHQLGIGECTNSTNFYFTEDPKNRLFEISELSRIALERCTKAKDAVQLMGSLAEKYGYYGFGETLLLADPSEGWVFEISCSPNGKGALWVAQKIPDGEVFVAANQFRIQDIRINDPDMLYSANLFSIAKEQKVWDESSQNPLNWLSLVCPGEFDHPYYSLRRVWRVQSLLNPSLNLSPWVDNAFTKYYPFAIKPEKKLSLKNIMRVLRDHYEGTDFDMTKGLASGPYGSPMRYLGPYDTCDFPEKRKEPLKGAWERPISIYYTGYSYINQLRSSLPDEIGGVCWVGFDDPYTTCYIPMYAGVYDLPENFQKGSPENYENSFAWWPFNIVSNWISFWHNYSIADVLSKQAELENLAFSQQTSVEKKALSLYQVNPKAAKNYLTKYCMEHSALVNKEWVNLLHFVMEKFNDGFINKPKVGTKVGYDSWWLNSVGYDRGPTDYKKKESKSLQK
jgi:dipeptidase